MSALLALSFAAGVGLLWAGAVCQAELPWRRTQRQPPALALPSARLLVLFVAAGVIAAMAAWSLVRIPILALAAGLAGGYAPLSWASRNRERQRRERERAWPAALAQLADALEAGLAFPAAVALVANAGPSPLRAELAAFHTRLRSLGLAAALDGLSQAGERTADTVALLLRAGLLELPSGGLAPVLRELAEVLSERLEAREKARSRAESLQLEAGILALSPIVLLLLIGASSPGYLDAYRTLAGSVVALVGGLAIFGCYLLMRRLGRVPEPRRTGAGR